MGNHLGRKELKIFNRKQKFGNKNSTKREQQQGKGVNEQQLD